MTATSLPPGPRLPRSLQSLRWMVRPLDFMERCRRLYGDVFTIKIAQEGTWVNVSDPALVKQVFTGDPEILHAGEGNHILEPLLGSNSVLLLDDKPHLRQRRLLLPPFHGDRMQAYVETMRRAAADELERWPAGTAAPAHPRMQEVTLEVIVRTVFGVTDRERLAPLRGALQAMLDELMKPLTMLLGAAIGPDRIERVPALAGLPRALDRVDALAFAEIARRRTEHGDGGASDDVLSMLLDARHEDGSPMTDQELRDELMTLLIAGHETTATTLAWAFERLARHPEALERLERETAAGETAYADAVIQETLRLRPVLPIVTRKLKADYRLGDWLLPEGTTITPCIYLMHTRPDIYPDPYAFKPERFLETPPGTYTWIPFGGGIRRCIGASFALIEARVVLQTVLERMRLRPISAADERVARRTITLTPSLGGQIVLEPR